MSQTSFRMETPTAVLQSIREELYMVSLDLKVVYFQVLFHPSPRKFLWLCLEDSVLEFESSASTFFTLLRRSSPESRQLW